MDLRLKEKSIPAACGNNNKQFCSKHKKHQQMDGRDCHRKVVAKERTKPNTGMNYDNISQLWRELIWKMRI